MFPKGWTGILSTEKTECDRTELKYPLLKYPHCCIRGAQKPQTYYSQLCEFIFLNFAIIARDWSKENLCRNKKRPGRGPGKEKKKREGPVSIRKFAHPNLCTLGGVVCKLLQVPLQGIQLLGELPGFKRKTMEEGQLRIKQSFSSAKETFPLTSRHLGSSQLLGAERPTALFLFWQHYSEWA